MSATLKELVKPYTVSSEDMILILCEGEKTEVNYLEGLIEMFDLPRERIVIYHPVKFTPLSQVRQAARILLLSKMEERAGGPKFTEAWLVFDRDNHHDFEEALDYSLCYPDIYIASSDPCVELWFLHHLRDQKEPFDPRGAPIRTWTDQETLDDGRIKETVTTLYERGNPQQRCIETFRTEFPGGYRKRDENITHRLGKGRLQEAMKRDWPVLAKQKSDRSECWTLMPELVLRLLLLKYPLEMALELLGLPMPEDRSGIVARFGKESPKRADELFEMPKEITNLKELEKKRRAQRLREPHMPYLTSGPVFYDLLSRMLSTISSHRRPAEESAADDKENDDLFLPEPFRDQKN
ncbi:RloB family protein [Sutterella sp.]|uniref:RloB family protein n=1 Tax=Sutterella sp. TaxID=1981025 RepID=UPI0026E02ED1|nr:RloB family protein [Sutterella sp.]MDO5532434.1 RloB family protein [Sutterella sp.]